GIGRTILRCAQADEHEVGCFDEHTALVPGKLVSGNECRTVLAPRCIGPAEVATPGRGLSTWGSHSGIVEPTHGRTGIERGLAARGRFGVVERSVIADL